MLKIKLNRIINEEFKKLDELFLTLGDEKATKPRTKVYMWEAGFAPENV